MLKRTLLALVFLAVASGNALGQNNNAARAFQQDATGDDADGLTKPVVTRSLKPIYTPQAMRAQVQGSVGVQVVVAPDGSVARARVVNVEWSASTDGTTSFTDATTGLVTEALNAAKGYRFSPGTLKGTPVPVMTTITLTFKLH